MASDDMRGLIKEIRKKVRDQRKLVCEEPLNKIDPDKQAEIFNTFLNTMKNEVKKSSDEGKYIEVLCKNFEEMKLAEIRYTVEKTYDRYDNVIDLMNKYSDNFDEEEFLKYNSRYGVLDKMLKFMIENTMGEYKTSDGDE
jgi:hypothetical protein